MAKKKLKLEGRLVVVHPLLTTDPADKHGKIGIVKSCINDQVAYVKFEDKSVSAYQLDGLLTLNSQNRILEGIGNNVFSGDDLTLVLKVYSSKEQGRNWIALNLAVSNENVAAICLENCSEWLRQNQGKVLPKGKKL